MDQKPREAPSLKAFTSLYKLHNTLETVLAQSLRYPPVLQGSGFPILEAILHRGPLTQGHLAGKILRTSGNISQTIDRLEAAGLVLRTAGPDRRSKLVELTPEGRELITEYFRRTAEAITAAFSVLEPAELEALAALCKKVGLDLTKH